MFSWQCPEEGESEDSSLPRTGGTDPSFCSPALRLYNLCVTKGPTTKAFAASKAEAVTMTFGVSAPKEGSPVGTDTPVQCTGNMPGGHGDLQAGHEVP